MDTPRTIAGAEGHPLLVACMAACIDCHRTLRGYALDAAEAAPGDASERMLWRQLLDCAAVCEATADYARCGSVFLAAVVVACTRICDECAVACEQLQPGPSIDACAEACRRCARACFAITLHHLRQGRSAPRAIG